MLVAPGTYQEPSQALVLNKSVTVYAHGADLKPHTTGEPVLEITGAVNVTIEGLQVHDGGATTGYGVFVHNTAGNVPNATLREMRIDSNAGGGVFISNAQFTLVNDFIVNNGATNSATGGVSIQMVTASGTHVFDFNTVSLNSAGSGINSGVDCLAVTVPLAFADSIVYGNPVLSGGQQVGGNNCSWSYSDVGTTVAGTGNINMDPQFVNAAQGDFHIMSTSPAKDAADPAATVNVDYDGDARPQGARSDMGADEVK
jgi:hypothetical protein